MRRVDFESPKTGSEWPFDLPAGSIEDGVVAAEGRVDKLEGVEPVARDDGRKRVDAIRGIAPVGVKVLELETAKFREVAEEVGHYVGTEAAHREGF